MSTGYSEGRSLATFVTSYNSPDPGDILAEVVAGAKGISINSITVQTGTAATTAAAFAVDFSRLPEPGGTGSAVDLGQAVLGVIAKGNQVVLSKKGEGISGPSTGSFEIPPGQSFAVRLKVKGGAGAGHIVIDYNEFAVGSVNPDADNETLPISGKTRINQVIAAP
tara:strand:+ start:801 stop:1298 length:498 start_codon:yes stop_codon:yes gene_type:complete